MQTPECAAFVLAYQSASARLKSARNKVAGVVTRGPAFQKLLNEVAAAGLDCDQAREALRVHNGGHPQVN